MIKNENDETIYGTTSNIGNSILNIKKQLNNISLNEKKTFKIPKIKATKSFNKNNSHSTRIKNNLKNVLMNNTNENGMKNQFLIQHNLSFSILNTFSHNDIIAKNKELQNENDLLKENVRFLLTQIKKKKKKDSKQNINDLSQKCGDIAKNENIKKSKTDNKINNVFDIINKYKKEINSLKEEVNNLTKENEILKESVYNQTNAIDKSKNNYKRTTLSHNNNVIIKKPYSKKNILFNNRNQLRKKELILMPYRRKTFNRTCSHFKSNTSDNYTYDNTFSIEKFTKTYKNLKNNNIFNNNNNFSFSTSQKYTNKKYIFNTFNSKNKNFIIIDSDFKGEEKIEDKLKNDKRFKNKDDEESPSTLHKELYYRKQVSKCKIKKLDFNGKEYNNNTINSTKSTKINNDYNNNHNNRFKIRIMKMNKSNNL